MIWMEGKQSLYGCGSTDHALVVQVRWPVAQLNAFRRDHVATWQGVQANQPKAFGKDVIKRAEVVATRNLMHYSGGGYPKPKCSSAQVLKCPSHTPLTWCFHWFFSVNGEWEFASQIYVSSKCSD